MCLIGGGVRELGPVSVLHDLVVHPPSSQVAFCHIIRALAVPPSKDLSWPRDISGNATYAAWGTTEEPFVERAASYAARGVAFRFPISLDFL